MLCHNNGCLTVKEMQIGTVALPKTMGQSQVHRENQKPGPNAFYGAV